MFPNCRSKSLQVGDIVGVRVAVGSVVGGSVEPAAYIMPGKQRCVDSTV